MRKTFLILFICLASILLLGGCRLLPDISSSGADSSSAPFSDKSLTSAESTIRYRLFMQNGHIMLKPASRDDHIIGTLNGSSLYYELSEDGKRWETAEFSLSKIGSVTGSRYNDDNVTTTDVFKVTIGRWTGFCKRAATEAQDNIGRRIMLEDNYGNTEFDQKTLNHTVMQIYDDLYSIGADDELKMVSARITGSYDYSAISKESAGDLYGWSWVKSPVCSPDSDLVFYLTSREGSFYSIWVLDLESGTEGRFCDEISPSLRGIGDQKLIAISDPDLIGAPFGRLISTSDPDVFEAVHDNSWSAVNGWLYHDNDPGGVTLLKGQYELNVDLSEYSFQIQPVGTYIWIINDVLQNGPPEYIKVDLISGSFSSVRSAYEMTLKGWSDLLEDLRGNEIPFGETDRVTIG